MAAFNLDERDMAKDPQIDDIIASLNTFPMGSEFRLEMCIRDRIHMADHNIPSLF